MLLEVEDGLPRPALGDQGRGQARARRQRGGIDARLLFPEGNGVRPNRDLGALAAAKAPSTTTASAKEAGRLRRDKSFNPAPNSAAQAKPERYE